MSRGWCPVCDRLVGISPGERQSPAFSSRWWLLDVHALNGKLCEGSGKRI